MERILENEFLVLCTDREQSVFMYQWKDGSKNLDETILLTEAQRILEHLLLSDCDYIIGDDRYFRMTISLELQEQINTTMLYHLNNKIKKFIHICSPSFFAQLSVEQLFDNNTNKTYSDHYVEELEEAMQIINDSIPC